jgi:hypothetical protein
VVPGLAGQVLRHAAAAVPPATLLGLAPCCRFDRRLGGRVLARSHLREQQGLVGIEALAARPVQAPQQQVEPAPPLSFLFLVARSARGHDCALLPEELQHGRQ